MEAHGIQPSLYTPAPRRLSGRRAGRKLAVVAVGSCLAVFGATGVAGAVTIPDASPIFCTAGVPCGGVSDTTPTTLPTVTKKDAEAAKKAAKKAADAAKKAAKKDHVNGHDLKQILGDSSLVDNGGHKWG
jgi:hypothetical protein